MGDMADAILDGEFDEWSGEYLGPGVGYPRSNDPDHPSNAWKRRKKHNSAYRQATHNELKGVQQSDPRYGGVYNWLLMVKCPIPLDDLIRKYTDQVDNLRGHTPRIGTICKYISQGDFQKFKDWYDSIKYSLKP